MAEHEITISALAAELGISNKSMAAKLCGKSEFKMGEAIKVARVLGLNADDMKSIYPDLP